MREVYSGLLKSYFHTRLIAVRNHLCLSQAKMAEQLLMDPRSYADLEHGRSGCGALTLILFLLYCCPDSSEFLAGIRAILEETKHSAA